MRPIDENALDFEDCVLFAKAGTIYGDFGKMMRKIGEAPTVDAVEVVHGRWKEYSARGIITGGGSPIWKCSVCGEIRGASLTPPSDKYCSNCGAKMDEVQK